MQIWHPEYFTSNQAHLTGSLEEYGVTLYPSNSPTQLGNTTDFLWKHRSTFIMFPTNMAENCEFLNHSKGNHLCNALYSGLLHWQPMLLACLLSRLSNFSSANNSLVSHSHSDMLLIYSNKSSSKSL